MEVRPAPGSLANPEPEGRKTALQRLAFPAFPARCGVLGDQTLQPVANYSGQGSVPIDGYLAHLPNEFVVERKCDVHTPIIREPLNQCKAPPTA